MNVINSKIEGLFLLILAIFLPNFVQGFPPRRVKFAGCFDNVARPVAVFMSCANKRGDCEVRKDSVHTLRAFFRPKHNATAVESFAAWNSWLQVPLPNQDHDACKNLYQCPLVENRLNSFTYKLKVEAFWPADTYPVIWTLTNAETEEEVLCFRFRIIIN
ncbi:UNVERIFIED_CONTAM: hypothetical protein RMT77_001133 [Armadillidium vulgare]